MINKSRFVYIYYTLLNSSSVRAIGVIAMMVLGVLILSGEALILPVFLCVLLSIITRKIFISCCVFFCFLIIIFTFFEPKILVEIPQKFSGIVIFHPKISSEKSKIFVFSPELNSRVEIQFYKKLEIAIGDKLEINCKPEKDEENYYKFLGVEYSIKNCSKIDIVKENSNGIISLISDFRTGITKKSDELFTRSTSSLVKGLLIGDSNDIPDAIKDDYKSAGIMHIVAVSGFNMSVVAGFITILLQKIKHKIKVILVTTSLLFYLSVVGFDNIPALKAFFLITILNIAKLVGRRPNPVYSTLISSLLVMLIMPSVFKSISFQLSSLAGLAIAIFPQKYSLVMVNLFVLPVMVLAFGTANPLGILSNIIILPLVEPLTFLSICALANPMNSFKVLSVFVDWIVRLIQSLAGTIASIPFSTVMVGDSNTILGLIIMLIIAILIFEFNYRSHTS